MANIPVKVNPAITLRDYQSAAKTFNTNNYANIPKTKFWYSIYFELNQAALSVINNTLNTSLTNGRITWQPNSLPVLGVLAKNVQLPSFKFDVKRLNQYNRWALNVNKIDYEPIEVSFWDDTIGQISGFWYAYYSYMIQDPNYSNFFASQTQGLPVPIQWNQSNGNISGSPATAQSSLYSSSDNWYNNYGLDTNILTQQTFGRNQPFFKSIRIYQFTRATDTAIGPTYNEFVLVNPVISNFRFDELSYSASEFTENKMTVEYETVLFNHGLMSNDEIASWDRVTTTLFDNSPSPLGTSVTPTNTSSTSSFGDNAIVTPQNVPPIYNVTTIKSAPTSSSAQVTDSTMSGLPGINSSVTVPNSAATLGEGGLPPSVVA